MNSISVESLKELIPMVNLIDIRDNYQYNMGRIPTAINVPSNFLLMNPENYMNKNDKYYLYCDYGTRSEKACETLSNKGYHVINVQGGYNEYKLLMHKQ